MNQRPLVLVLALVAAVGGFYAFRAFAETQKESAERTQMFADAEEALGQSKDAAFDPSKLVARLQALPPTDREARVLLGRLEARRQRYDRALEHLQGVLEDGDELALRTAALASFRQQQLAAVDATTQRQLLQQAIECAERAASTSSDPADWFLCWEAATRLPDAAAADRALAALARTPDSLPSRTAALLSPLRSESAAMPTLETVSALVAEWTEPPVELELLQAALFLEAKEFDRALSISTALLAASPNQFEVRQLAATVHHVAVQMEAAGPQRDRHVALRDAQIQWLDANAPADDSRRPLWLSWKQVR